MLNKKYNKVMKALKMLSHNDSLFSLQFFIINININSKYNAGILWMLEYISELHREFQILKTVSI